MDMSTMLQNKAFKQSKIFPLPRRLRSLVVTTTLIVIDLLALGASFWLAYFIRFKFLPYYASYDPAKYMLMIIIIMIVWLCIFAAYQLYSPQVLFGGMQEYSRIFSAVTSGMLAVIGADYLARQESMVSRGWLVISWLLSLFMVVLCRFCFRRLVYLLRKKGHFLSPAVIVGTNTEGLALAAQLKHQDTSGLFLLGMIGMSKPEPDDATVMVKYLGELEQVEEIIKQNQVQDVIVAQTALKRAELLEVFQTVTRLDGVNLRLSSGLFEVVSSGLRVKELAYVPLVEVSKTRISGVDVFMKLALDFSVTIPGVLLLSPFFALIAILIKRDSPGPVIHRRRVMGVNGSQFDAFKFRTMYIGGDCLLEENPELQDKLKNNYKIKDDPRVTRLGKFLRKWSLDELPQLFNVLRGEMSLVGPRMISPPEMEKYGKWGMNLLTVKPGLTGLWQVSGRSDIDYEERVRMDMHYIRNWTIWQDLYLIFTTLPAVLKQKGAY
jgi:exopolysaccharide biosynthesis polyprenyl glycosylphosphotransferase